MPIVNPEELSSIAQMVAEEVAKQREEGLYRILNLHIRALACHCECLGMNAENCAAACANTPPPYRDADYFAVMEKWDLMKEGKPIIWKN